MTTFIEQLHDIVRDIVVRDGLVPEESEWEKIPLRMGRKDMTKAEVVVDESDGRFLKVEDIKSEVGFVWYYFRAFFQWIS